MIRKIESESECVTSKWDTSHLPLERSWFILDVITITAPLSLTFFISLTNNNKNSNSHTIWLCFVFLRSAISFFINNNPCMKYGKNHTKNDGFKIPYKSSPEKFHCYGKVSCNDIIRSFYVPVMFFTFFRGNFQTSFRL